VSAKLIKHLLACARYHRQWAAELEKRRDRAYYERRDTRGAAHFEDLVCAHRHAWHDLKQAIELARAQ